MKRFSLFLFILFLSIGASNAQILHRNASRKVEKGLFGSKRKQVKVKEPRVVLKAKKDQETKDRKIDKAKKDYVVKSQKRSIAIQTPEVRTRMKQDRKDIRARDKTKKKKLYATTKRAGRKYK